MGRGREKWEREGEQGEGRERKGGERLGKWKGALDLDVCPGAPEVLVTPLNEIAEGGRCESPYRDTAESRSCSRPTDHRCRRHRVGGGGRVITMETAGR